MFVRFSSLSKSQSRPKMYLWCLFRVIAFCFARRKSRKDDPLKSARINLTQLKVDLAHAKGDRQVKVNVPDEVDGCADVRLVNGRFRCEDGEVKVRYVQPLFYRILLAWAFVELIALAYTSMKTCDRDSFSTNFLSQLCPEHGCKHVVQRMLSIKMISAVLLAIGGYKVSALLHLLGVCVLGGFGDFCAFAFLEWMRELEL